MNFRPRYKTSFWHGLVLWRSSARNLGRPNVDTLEGSDFANMKELRFRLDGLWRFAFAFDPSRRAIILCGGNKLGKKISIRR